MVTNYRYILLRDCCEGVEVVVVEFWAVVAIVIITVVKVGLQAYTLIVKMSDDVHRGRL